MEEDFALTKGDVLTEMVEGVPSITFLDRVQEYIERQMAKIIIVKLLGGEIGFNVLLNKITLLWNPKCPIQLMDLENDFFVVRFQDKNDYNKALIRGLWGYYSDYLLRVIDKTIGPVVKLDVHTDCARMGRFARLAVWVNLRKLLMSKVRINNHLQRVEYEALPNIYFKCGLYGHGADLGSGVKTT
ncbi:hypothetical protein Goklo_018408 [Gossypium klotzschianum]|uniref:DUF4283 domain-containing protein n=1 Tax=Gossypium klotzschianum TaxID=34286 RepID=A0A7J8UKL0_9ROSI|nr:hypothetical protein [Gossypium klotzschianum]